MEFSRNFGIHAPTGEPGVGSLAERAWPAGVFRAASHSHSGGRSRWIALFQEAPRWLLLVALIYAPWAYGSTRPWTIEILHWQLGLTLSWWTLSCLVQRRWPRIHPGLIIVVGLLLFQGWWMTLNAKFDFDAALTPSALEPLVGWAPGSVNKAVSLPNIIDISLMLGIACFACNLARRGEWRRRLWLVMALTGVSLLLLGLAQKITHAPGIFWKDEQFLRTFFATYRYHANAGAFINIIWPLVAGWLVISFGEGRSLARRILWTIALAICVASAFANTSRASSSIALLMLVGWGMWALFKAVRGHFESLELSHVIGVVLVSATVIIFVLGFGGLDTTWRRWSKVDQQFATNNQRLLVAGVCIDMLPQSGWFGFGPGTFCTAFPFFNKHTGPETRGVWLYAHEDYLQTLVEWGWIGSTVWVALLAGPALALRRVLRKPRRFAEHDRVFVVVAASGLGAVLVHAAVDFPLQVPSIQLYLATIVGALWNCKGCRDATGQTEECQIIDQSREATPRQKLFH